MIVVETSRQPLDECVLFALAVVESSGTTEQVRQREDLDPSCVEVHGDAEQLSFRWSPERSRFESTTAPAMNLVVPFSVDEPPTSRVRRILYEEISPRQLRMTARVIESVKSDEVIFACLGGERAGSAGATEIWPDLDVVELVRLVTASFAVLETVDDFEPHGRVSKLARALGIAIIDFAGDPVRREDDPGVSVGTWDPMAFARAITELRVAERAPVPRLPRGFASDLAGAVRS